MAAEIKHKACGMSHFECRCGMYVMPFGKYKGKTLSEINMADGGRRYLQWCEENVDPGEAIYFISSFLTRFPR